MLRGAPAPHVLAAGPANTFRRKYADPDPTNNFIIPVARLWFAIDVDDVDAPPGMDWLQDVPAASRWLLGLLPPELTGVTCIVQATGSAGFTGAGLMRLRLWFALTEEVGDADLRRWANAWTAKVQTHLIDPAIYNPVQLHYTATPILGAGVIDPVHGNRWHLSVARKDVLAM